MIFITGDVHADFRRFNNNSFYEQKETTKNDYLIVCGDFGIWDDSPRERYELDILNARSFTTLFVTGNHSNYDLLASFPISEWHGGKVQFIRDSVIHLMRSQMYDICGKKFFTMGGASSHDISDGILEPDDPKFKSKRRELDNRDAVYRINYRTWWKEELPNDKEYRAAINTLDAHGWRTDYIITHCLPTSVANEIGRGLYAPDKLTDFLEEITQRCEFRYLFCGHYHINRIVMEKYVVLYEQIVRIDS